MNMLLNGRYSFFLSSFRAKSQFYNRISCHSALNPHIRYAFPMPLLPVIALSHPQPEDPYLSWLTCCFVKDFFSQLAVCFFTACLVFMRVGWHIVLLLGQEKNVFTTRAGSPTGTHVLSPQLGAVLLFAIQTHSMSCCTTHPSSRVRKHLTPVLTQVIWSRCCCFCNLIFCISMHIKPASSSGVKPSFSCKYPCKNPQPTEIGGITPWLTPVLLFQWNFNHMSKRSETGPWF